VYKYTAVSLLGYSGFAENWE